MTPIATATNTAGPPIPMGHDACYVAITPDGKTAYVAKGGITATVTPIATATNTPGPPIPAGPGAIAITPDGTTAYVTSSTSGTVTPIATATNTPGTPIPVRQISFLHRDHAGHRHSRARLHQWLRRDGCLRGTVLLHGDHDGLPGTEDHQKRLAARGREVHR